MISVKQSASNQTDSVNASVGSSTNPVIGNKIIVICFAASINTGSLSCTDNAGNTYTNTHTISYGSGGIAIFTAPVTATTSGFTITLSPINTTTAGATTIFIELSGLTTTEDIYSQQGGSGSTTQDPASITTAYNNDFILAVMASDDTSASITDSPSSHGWTDVNQWSSASPPNQLGDICYRITNSASTYDPQWTTSSMTGNWAAIQIAYIGVGAMKPDSVFAQSFFLTMP